MNTNPLFAPLESLLDYAQIEPKHVQEAIPTLLAQNKQYIEQLTDKAKTSPVTFEALCLDTSSQLLGRAWSVANHLNAVVSTTELREVINQLLPEMTAYSTWLGLNKDLYDCYQQLSKTNLTPLQRRVVDLALQNFELAGIHLTGEAKEAFARNSESQAIANQKFSENCLDATDQWFYLCKNPQALSGLPQASIDAAAREAAQDGAWKFTLKAPSLIPVLKYADDRTLRHAVHKAYTTLASDQSDNPDFNNASLIEQLLQLRLEQARLLGYEQFADLQLQTRMADDTQTVIKFLRDLAKHAKPYAEQDMQTLKAFAKTTLNMPELEAGDYAYASEKLRQANYHYSEEDVRQYLPQSKVMQGLQALIKRLFNIDMTLLSEVSTWHPDVDVYRLEDNGEALGYLYADLYARKGKQSGAWVNSIRSRLRLEDNTVVLPVATLTCNFSSAQGERPALLTHNEVITLFHEMGHALHCILSKVDYPDASAFSAVEWDAIELPSQFMENFCWEKSVLQSMSEHWQTKEPLPDTLFEKLIQAKNFQSGSQTVRQIEFALFDMLLHSQNEALNIEAVLDLLNQVRQEVAVIIPPEWNRFPHSFSHIFAGGYAAGYYSYKWAEVLSADAYAAFEESSHYGETGMRFRKEILEVGGSRPAADSFQAFRGRAPRIDALLRHGGMHS